MSQTEKDAGRWPGDVEAPSFRPNPAHARKEIPDEVLADAQNLFETTALPLSEIARRVGLHRSLLHRTVLRKGWRRPTGRKLRDMLATRLRARVEKELASAELSLAQRAPTASAVEALRYAETLSSLIKTLRELQRYDAETAAAAREAQSREEDPYEGGDLDGFRLKLAQRLDRLRREVEARQAEESAGGEAGA